MEQKPPPSYPKPWFYKDGYLHAAFIFWPFWSILILRSPWHNGIWSGGFAWAVLFIGGFLGLKWIQAGTYQNVIVLFMPGVLLTIFTQIQWATHKRTYARARPSAPPPARPASESSGQPRRSAPRRRNRRRGSK